MVKKLLVLWVLLVSLLILGCLGGGSPPISAPPMLTQCTLPPGFSCVTYKLHANTGELDLEIGQIFGGTINVTGVACTQKETSPSYLNNYASDPITITSGSRKFISKPSTSHVVKCTDANGNPLSDTSVGARYEGKIYINYTKLATEEATTVSGPFWAKFES
ncbi:MAG: hypothetical protein Sv326_0321 [Candidatus Fermentimicrarchaeum limneticum]|uniref:Lipoprotein n=1 Tax=Fermentimicrarchaeum limneticum TaxID=2795018 RepID=A0A7D6BL50_FERL1|nr:MAG: hypothetical protein Sv326_0321 [Candidatus Fermentimicrarchaeum limneticum]